MGMLALHSEPELMPTLRSTMERLPQRVLLAEDDDDTRRLLAARLRVMGYEVHEAIDGAEMLSNLEKSARRDSPFGPFTAIVADHQMPYLEGLDVLAALGAAHWRVPFILISAHVDAALHADARMLGSAAVLKKPIDVAILDRAITMAVEATTC